MNFKRINNITGWVVFAIAFIVYFMTMAPTASFWDCGEFIACANELEVPHPPGAPFFLLVGRVFAIFAGDPTNVAFMLNLMSVLSSAFTILFTFWITTHLARKMLSGDKKLPADNDYLAQVESTEKQTPVIMLAGLVGALTCTFADSFWFNAVEAEVYAMSSLFTAAVVWLMFKWEERADEPGNERWIILIAYLMGLSMGVHLLNLLAVPALAFIYYFRKYPFTWVGFLATGVISVAILGIIQTGILLYTFDFAWGFEKIFTGTVTSSGQTSGMGLPLGTGMILFFLILFGLMVGGIAYSVRQKKPLLNTVLLSTLVIYIGFSSYLMVPIRSNANPAIDENNPDNTSTFLSYMKREQYGDRPLFRGPLYNARPIDLTTTGKEYVLDEGADRYRVLGEKRRYKYSPQDMKLFPRMYYMEQNRWRDGPHAYVNYVRRTGDPNQRIDDKPTGGEDLDFFLDYQVGHMYVRYFMWNFAGKEGDVQDMGWESGFVSESKPELIEKDRANNHYYLLPLLLGLLGAFTQANKRWQDATVIGLLFFFTGLAIIIYLNQYPMQPRERDYSFAGSFQTFAIWVGLGVIGLYELLKKYLGNTAMYVAGAIGLAAPIIMGVQNWDDHTRKGRYIAPDSAYNLLNSLAPNAILFTNGDNDTFPLWYIQEVENVRPDVRVLCLSYVNTDWYIDQMYRQYNESPPLPLSLKKERYVGQENQAWEQRGKQRLTVSLTANAQELLDQEIIEEKDLPFVQNPMRWEVPTRGSGQQRYLELRDVVVLNLLENISKNGWTRPLYFANTVTRNSMLALQPFLRLEGMAYRVLPVRNPLPSDPYDPNIGGVASDLMFANLTEKFRYRNLDNPSVYYDENARKTVLNYHSVYYRLASAMLLEADSLETRVTRLQQLQEEGGEEDYTAQISAAQNRSTQLKEKAKSVMLFGVEKFPKEVITPPLYILTRTGIMLERVGEMEKAQEYFDFVKKHSMEALAYYQGKENGAELMGEYYLALQILSRHYGTNQEGEKITQLLSDLDSLGVPSGPVLGPGGR